MSTFTGECQQTPNTSVKDQIYHYILVHSDPHRCMSTITDILQRTPGREEKTPFLETQFYEFKKGEKNSN
jgi:hypothetical protein